MTNLPLYRDAGASIDERIADLLGRMTVAEKVAQLGSVWLTKLVRRGRFDADHVAATIPDGIGHVTRIGASTGLRPAGVATLMNEIQRVALERTRLGIPVVVHEESVAGLCARDATVFPQAIGLAATWDPELVEAVGEVIRAQLVAIGARHTLAPVLDVARDPRWGRVEETYGEDPVLTGTLGTAYVRGVQSGDLRGGAICTAKHFLGYGLSEGGRNHGPAHIGPRELREVYAEPFAAAIRDAGLASVMNSYGSVDGLPCAGSVEVLTGLLRDELGFDGVVVADYWAVSWLVSSHRTAADLGEAAAQALEAGLDIELPALEAYARLPEQVARGRVAEATLDQAVERALAAKLRLGLFENPYVDAEAAPLVFDTPDQRVLARRAAARSLVLLRNDGVLPLAVGAEPGGVRRIAIVGPGADDPRLLQGDYHYPAHLELLMERNGGGPVEGDGMLPHNGGAFDPGYHYTEHVTPRTGLARALAGRAELAYEPGCEVTGDDRSGLDAAVAATAQADVAVVCVAGRSGLVPACTVGEARDATDLRLTGLQEDLVQAVAATGTPTVVVVLSGRVHELTDIVDDVSALLYAWPAGEEGGAALADVLLGVESPGGRLPVTLPRRVGQVPLHHAHRSGGSRSKFYDDYSDAPAAPLFPFGFGLSYTRFEYRALSCVAGSTGSPVEARVTVANVGERDGDEVVQLYVRDDVASVARPERQLVGFARVTIPAGESREVVFRVDPSRLAFFDAAMRFVTEPGDFTFSAGDRRQTVALTGDLAVCRQRDIVATRVEVLVPSR